MKCVPMHPHHRGNEAADRLATAGLAGEEPKEYNLRCTTGDEHFTLRRQGQLCQGDISSSLKGAAVDARRNEMEEGTGSRPPSAKATQWLAMMKMSEDSIVGWMSKQKSVSSRYRVRAWAEVLPTYSNEVKKVNSNGNKADIYGDLLGQGECVCCSMKHPETMEHIVECTENMVERDKQQRGKVRQEAKTKVATILRKAGLMDAWQEV